MLATLVILPTLIPLLVLLDIFFMAFSVLAYTTLLPCSFFRFGERLFDIFEAVENGVFFKLLGLSQMEVQGFRS